MAEPRIRITDHAAQQAKRGLDLEATIEIVRSAEQVVGYVPVGSFDSRSG